MTPRRPFREWHPETFTCSFQGHDTPAAAVERLRPEDAGVGFDLPDGRRLVRCLRCDVWVQTGPPAPGEATAQTLPPLADLEIPKRGRPLRDSIVLKLIAVDRGVHAILFGALAVALIYLDTHLGSLQSGAARLLQAIDASLSNTGQDPSRDFLSKELTKVLHLHSNTVVVLAGTAVAYSLVEAVEAVGLWKEQRWAEYLTAVATAGFLPFEVKALIDRVTVFRVLTLVVNVAILVWLLWQKRLFGIRGGPQPHDADIDRQELFGPPSPGRGVAMRHAGTPTEEAVRG